MVASQVVASQASIDDRIESTAYGLASQMESMAAKGDWQRAEQLAVLIQAAVHDIAENERGHQISFIRKSLDRVQTMALASRVEVTEKLSEIRRGRAAKLAYGQRDSRAEPNALR